MQITCNTSSAYHVQHIKCFSRATHQVLITCNTSSAYHVQHIKCFSRATHQVQHIKCFSRATHQVLITCNTSSAYHVQHIKCLSRATHQVLLTCNMSCATWFVRRDSSANKVDSVEITFVLVVIFLAETFNLPQVKMRVGCLRRRLLLLSVVVKNVLNYVLMCVDLL